jgi:hypothetical protein
MGTLVVSFRLFLLERVQEKRYFLYRPLGLSIKKSDLKNKEKENTDIIESRKPLIERSIWYF